MRTAGFWPFSHHVRDWGLVAGVAVAVAVGAVLRIVHLGHALIAPDEPTVMDRAVAIAHGRGGPTEYDWPPAAMNLLAGLMKATGTVGSYLFGRWVFVLVSLAVIALAGALGAELADGPRGGGATARRYTAWATAGLMAVSYLSVRLGRQVHPDHLQLVFVLASFLAILRYDRDPEGGRRWLVAAGAAAGLAGATKYLGGLVIVPAAATVLLRRRPKDLAVLAAAAVGGLLAGAPQLVTHWSQFWDGVGFQFGHQAGGHLGYDSDHPAWWFHLRNSLPGNWGWAVTVLAVVGLVWTLRKGTRAQRLAAAYVVPTYLAVGAGKVRFPHYVVPVLPFLAAYAAVAALRLAPRIRTTPVMALLALAALVFPIALDDARLVRAAGATDTRTLATRAVAALPDGTAVWTERYGSLDLRRATPLPDFGTHPEVLECRCVAVVSSYLEERYRREPARYAAEVGVYDAIRRRGRVLATIGPNRHLAYDWDLLPAWGMDRIPLSGDTGPVGPTITLVDLRRG